MTGTRALALVTLALATVLGLAPTAAAELYRWTDAEGRVHVTQDLYKVPPEYRDQLDRSAGKGSFVRVEGLNAPRRGEDPEAEAAAAAEASGEAQGGRLHGALSEAGLDVSSTAGFVFLLCVIPLGALSLYLVQRMLSSHDENLGVKSLIAVFFHRLFCGVGTWALLLTGTVVGFGADQALPLLGLHLGVGAVVFAFFLPGGLPRAVVASLLFLVLDNLVLAAALVGTRAIGV